MVSMNIKISERTKLIKLVMIVSKILFSDIIQNNQPLNEKVIENKQNSQTLDETPAIVIGDWDKLPDEIVEKNWYIDTGH